jgi:hypothetical protein
MTFGISIRTFRSETPEFAPGPAGTRALAQSDGRTETLPISANPSEPQPTDYVRDHAPDLDVNEVIAFMNQHDMPEDEKGHHVEWAIRSLRERRAADRPGPSVDRIASEMRRHDTNQ